MFIRILSFMLSGKIFPILFPIPPPKKTIPTILIAIVRIGSRQPMSITRNVLAAQSSIRAHILIPMPMALATFADM